MFTKRHTRQRLVVAGPTVAALLTGALVVRTELIETTLELGRVREGDRHRRRPHREPGDDHRARRQDGRPPNRYFDGMVDIVNRDEGTVNNNSDNITVLWGAPLEVKEQARKAVECALEMQPWIVSEREKGRPDVSFGFGMGYH